MSFVYVNKQARDPRAFAQAYCHRLCSAAVMTFSALRHRGKRWREWSPRYVCLILAYIIIRKLLVLSLTEPMLALEVASAVTKS